jgi:flavin-dependent dehydrogenase
MESARDVVIVGAGPAGATTALACARATPGFARRVLLLEKARFPRDKPCAGALGARGDALLASLGVRVDVPSVAIDGMSFRGVEGTVVAAPGRIGRVIRRIEFDHALVREAVAHGVELRDGVRVDRVRALDGRALVETSEGTLQVAAVVGCDGVGSVVRKALGTASTRWRAQVVEVDTEPAAGDPPRSLLHFDASDRRYHGYAWDFPTLVDGRKLVCRGVYRLTAKGADDVSALLAERLRARGIDPAAGKNRRYAERGFDPGGVVARGPLMLAGESAGIDPVTGEGIAQAIEFGVLAGRFLARQLAGGGPALALDGWADELWASRLVRDLRIRGRFADLYYGPARTEVERFFTETPGAMAVGCRHFAAQAQDWPLVGDVLARGAARAVAAGIGRLLGGRPS